MVFVDSLMFGLVLYIWSIKIRNVNLENIKCMMPSNLNPKDGLWCRHETRKKLTYRQKAYVLYVRRHQSGINCRHKYKVITLITSAGV